MPEEKKGDRQVLLEDGLTFEYDSVVKIYIDSKTGNWVCRTNLEPESIVDVLSDAQDHFVAILEDEGENEITQIDGNLVYPSKDPDYN